MVYTVTFNPALDYIIKIEKRQTSSGYAQKELFIQ